MVVEATKGDLGAGDVSAAKVTDIARDVRGTVFEKGTVFKTRIEVSVPCSYIGHADHVGASNVAARSAAVALP
jgi:hypothetical protein